MKTTKFLAICAIALFCNLPLWAGDVVSPNGGELDLGNVKPTITFTTNHFGDVVIRLNDTKSATNVYFRGTICADGIGGFQVNGGSANTYFDLDFAHNNKFVTLKKKSDVTVPDNATICLNNKDIYFICKEKTNNAQKQAIITYTYGTVWGTLASANPVIKSFNTATGQMTFDPIDGADSYVATVYLGRYKAYEQPITSGGNVAFGAYTDGEYEVTLKAIAANGDESKESEGVKWSLEGDNKYLPKSPVYQQLVINPQEGGDFLKTTALITFVTDKQTGVMTITMSETDGDADGKALFHGHDGLTPDGLKYDGKPIGDYFTRSVPGSNDGNADGKPQIVYTPNKTGNVPEYGKMITFNGYNEGKAFSWRTGRKNNTNTQYLRFEYIYGTDATEPIPPTPPTPGIPQITNIAANNVITFTGIDDATRYDLRVTDSSDGDVYSQTNITSGETIAYYCYETGTYKVYIDAIKESETVSSAAYSWNVTKHVPVISTIDADWKITFTGTQCADSYNLRVLDGETPMYSQVSISSGDVINFTDYHTRTYNVYVDAVKNSVVVSTSAPFDWALVNPDEPLPSEYCSAVLSSNNTNILLTWETNFVGDVVMRMANGEKTTNAVARGSEGLGNLTWFKINSSSKGVPEDASTYFTWEYAGEGSTTAALRRKPGATLPTGAIIEYHNHPIQWKCDQYSNPSATITWNYTYGSTCANLSTPKNLSVAQDGTITFSEVAGATTYTARVYDEAESDLLYEQDVVSGNQLTYKAYEDGNYKVTIQATNAQGGYSNESQPAVVWTLTGDIGNLPASNVCDQLIHQDNKSESYAYISINTDENGAFMITIAPDNAKFRGGSYVSESGLKYNGEPLTNYFTRTFSQDYKTLTYTPKEKADVHYGKKITFNKYGENAQIEWSIGSSTYTYNYNSPNMSFDYIYGTTCPVEITIYENQNNSTTLTNNNGKEVDVTLNRSFEADGANYTLCLPFSMTEEQCLAAFGSNYKLWKLGKAYMKTPDVMYLPFSEVTAIEAGKPYLFCPAANVVNPTIEGVTINAAAPVAWGEGCATMTGIYSPYELPVVNNYVLGDDNWLYQSDGNAMKGLRCYFTLTPSAATSNVRARAVFHNTDVVTDLETVDGSQCTMRDGKYVINGQFVIIRNNVRYNGIGQQVK